MATQPRGRGRFATPPAMLSVRVSRAHVDQLDRLAAGRELSRSAIVRELLQAALERESEESE